MSLLQEIDDLKQKVHTLEKFVDLFAAQFEPPKFFRKELEQGFRFTSPNYQHFCLLRSCRIVSALNASIELARAGYPQEIGVLLRTMIEYCSQVDFILLNRDDQGNVVGKAKSFVESYFDDVDRASDAERKRIKLNQQDVHKSIGSQLDYFNKKEPGARLAHQLLSRVYLIFSNYVHGRYPETMDLFGGRPGRFHLRGMSGTPKDAENIEILKTLTDTASNCFAGLVQGLKMQSLIEADWALNAWYSAVVGKDDQEKTQ